MKTKCLPIIALLALTLFAVGCGTTNQPQTPPTNAGEGSTPINPNSIPYTVASNYFVRNDVQTDAVIGKRIDTQAEFNEYFGAATTMGSEPTRINFANEYVIAVIGQPNFRQTELHVENVTQYRGIITLSYSQTGGQVQSFSTRPALIVVVDRMYNGQVLVVER